MSRFLSNTALAALVATIVAVPVAAFLLAILATVYPARRAAAIAPASALRYD